MEAHSSGGMSLRPRRKPLADLTNSPSIRFSSAADSVKPKPKPKPKVSPDYSSSKSAVSSAGSSDPKNVGDRESPKSTIVVKEISSVADVARNINCDFVGGKSGGQSTVRLKYVKEKIKEQKDVSFTTVSSCPPLGKTQRFRKNSLMKDGMNQNEAFSEPCQKRKKRQRCLGTAGRRHVDEDIPLQDFIQKQRAYFAEVDSFELPEEVVSESELE